MTDEELEQVVTDELAEWTRPRRGEGWVLWINEQTTMGRFSTAEVAYAVVARLRKEGVLG